MIGVFQLDAIIGRIILMDGTLSATGLAVEIVDETTGAIVPNSIHRAIVPPLLARAIAAKVNMLDVKPKLKLHLMHLYVPHPSLSLSFRLIGFNMLIRNAGTYSAQDLRTHLPRNFLQGEPERTWNQPSLRLNGLWTVQMGT